MNIGFVSPISSQAQVWCGFESHDFCSRGKVAEVGLDLRTVDPGVWFYDHDVGAFERQHDSLAEFGETLLEEMCRSRGS